MQKNISELEKDNRSLIKEINKHKEKIAQKNGQIVLERSKP